jgi:RecJ-like exonuclease
MKDKGKSRFSKDYPQRQFRERKEFKKEYTKKTRSIIQLRDGDFFSGTVKIMRKAQPGPVIFTVSDGYGSADAVIKDSNFDINDVVELEGEVNERAGRLQIEILKMIPSSQNFNAIIEKNSEPARTEFSIKSDRLQKMKPYFLKISKRIRRAVLENQSIMIRHHADSDGINAGLAIEHSCRQFMEKIGINPEYNLYRSPSRAPFYEVSDVFRDVVLTKRLIEGHGQMKPLIIVLDNGSTPEDIFGLKILKSLGFEVIVIDHHNPVIIENKKTAVDPYLSLHLNPYIEGLDSKTSAGMLAYEMARFIYEDYENKMLPAVAGISDRCDIAETEEYIKNSGKSRQFLEKIGIAIDFIAYNLKFDAGKGLFEELYTKIDLVETINEEVKKGVETQLQSTLPYLRTQDIEGVIFSTIDLEKYTVRFKYPAPGKVTGLIHDNVSEGKEMPVITIGYLSDMIILRATKPVLPIADIIKALKKKFPQANVDGGGHECAGAIKFVSAHQSDILENIKEQVRKLNYVANKSEE